MDGERGPSAPSTPAGERIYFAIGLFLTALSSLTECAAEAPQRLAKTATFYGYGNKTDGGAVLVVEEKDKTGPF